MNLIESDLRPCHRLPIFCQHFIWRRRIYIWRLCLLYAIAGIPSNVSAVEMLPDLTIWQSKSLHDWRVDKETIPGRTLLRFTVAIPNVGDGPLETRINNRDDGQQEIFQNILSTDGSASELLVGTFDNTSGHHGDLRFEGLARYNLRTESGGQVVATNLKRSECLVDSLIYAPILPGISTTPHYRDCHADVLGVSVGFVDLYPSTLQGQWIDITGVPNGNYWLEVEMDPFERVREIDRSNNSAGIAIELTQVPEPSSILFLSIIVLASFAGMYRKR